jgi:uncharacterized damage-inducible protein DinB
MNSQPSIASEAETLAPTHLQTLVTHLAWANRQLFAALRDVDSFESQKGSELIVRALDHIHASDASFRRTSKGARTATRPR